MAVKINSSVFSFKQVKSEMPKRYLKGGIRDFHGGPGVKTPCFQCRGHGFDPWSGKIPLASRYGQKQKQK